jgi:S-adenosylmethionine uptake transporter
MASYTPHQRYCYGIVWFIFAMTISCCGDVLMKYLGVRLHPLEVTFFRFAFSALTLLPVLCMRPAAFYTKRLPLHAARGIAFYVAITCWCIALTVVPVTTATTILFTMPMWVLLMAHLFLKEAIGWSRLLATVGGFVGIVFVMEPTALNSFPIKGLLLLLATFIFSGLDIVNKYYVEKESMLSMLFYSAAATTLVAAIPASFYWQIPNSKEFWLLLLLGIAANLMLYCILKAFSFVEASAVSPYRYVELIISGIMGYLVFGDIPTLWMLTGAAIIIPCMFFILWYETKHLAKQEIVL